MRPGRARLRSPVPREPRSRAPGAWVPLPSEVLESPDPVHVDHEAHQVRERPALIRPEHLELHGSVARLNEPQAGEHEVDLRGGDAHVLEDLAIAVATAL